MKHIFFIDTEVSEIDNKAYEYGAVNENDDKLHTGSAHEFDSFIAGAEYLCGHNIINHDFPVRTLQRLAMQMQNQEWTILQTDSASRNLVSFILSSRCERTVCLLI